MSKNFSRRKILTSVSSSVGFLTGFACSQRPQQEEIPFSERSWWLPGKNPDIVKDLKPGPTPIRLACHDLETRLQYPEKESITEVVKRIRDYGYTSAGANYSLDNRNKWLDATESEINELKEALRKYDVEFYDMMTGSNIVHPDKSMRHKYLKYLCENVEAAERCGVRNVCTLTGSRDGTPRTVRGIHPDNWSRETWKLTVDSIRQILRDTSGCKAALGMEALLTTSLDSPIAHKRLLEDVGDSRCKITLDPTNMYTLARYYHSTELINECFDLIGEDINCCHAKDVLILEDMLLYIRQVPPGKGIQDYETYLVRLSQMKLPRTLLLEFFTMEEYRIAKAFIEETAANVGVKIYN